MIARTKYKALLRRVKFHIGQHREVSYCPTMWMLDGEYQINGQGVYISRNEVDGAWPHIAKALGLVDDGTGSNTWTMPGRELDILPQLQEYAANKGAK